jgi:hypothetical protein
MMESSSRPRGVVEVGDQEEIMYLLHFQAETIRRRLGFEALISLVVHPHHLEVLPKLTNHMSRIHRARRLHLLRPQQKY